MAGLELHQRQIQSQVQVMSQRQIQALRILALNSADLTEAIYKEAEENPALVIVRDGRIGRKDGTRVAVPTARGEYASEQFQSALESAADSRTSLQQHLMSQLNMMKLSEAEQILCERLIYNLDARGFHILSPVSLLDKKDRRQTPGLLESCIEKVRQLDPAGICVVNMEESLLVQARQREDAPPLALFILDGKMQLLDPPRPEKIAQKARAYCESQKKLFAWNGETQCGQLDFSEEAAEKALAFIRSLEPFPARNFSVQETHFVAADVCVEEDSGSSEHSGEWSASVSGEKRWTVFLAKDSLPQVALSPEYARLAQESGSGEKPGREQLKKAQAFLGTLNYRQSTVLRACAEIVRIQEPFFLHGPGNLVPLRQQDIALRLGVHGTTVSRMACSKFLQCKWGLFSIKYFFTNAAGKKSSAVSRDRAMSELKKIIQSHREDSNASDRQLSEELARRGIAVSRRTVAKYRNLLQIESSYNR